MSIKDNVNEISENNVTIAENLEKVYNAGMRAGLAQDPDYSEGYDDGYEQGLTDSSGVVWEDLLSGKVPVGKAREADHADKATNAENAENAKNANHAKSADNATNANRATEANHAAEADHSVEADHATEADHSVEADHATNADKANTAVSADHATTATVANSTNSFNGVLPIEEGGTGANNPIDALKNLGQKPWDVNENVGSIVANEITKEDIPRGEWKVSSVTEGNWVTRTYHVVRFPMINSGEVYLHYYSGLYNGTGDTTPGAYMGYRILKNDEVVLEEQAYFYVDGISGISGIPNGGGLSALNGNRDLKLNVSKGDIIEIVAYYGTSTVSDANVTSDSYFNHIYLSANIDTPYKYIALVDVKETDMEEIINTLLGV